MIVRLPYQGDPHGLQIDLWIAHPERGDLFRIEPCNFGSLLLCRTGPIAHNVFLIEHAKRQGLTWNPYHGVSVAMGRCVAAETEEAIYQALKLVFIPPDRRNAFADEEQVASDPLQHPYKSNHDGNA